MKNNALLHSFQKVFRRPNYVALAFIFAAVIGVGIVWLSSYSLIWFAMTSDIFDWTARLKIFWTSLGVFMTNFTLASQIMIVVISALAGVNIAMLIYFKRTMTIQRAFGASALGLVIGIFGVGCSACGPVVLSSFLGVTAASVLASWLPLRGVEFGILSMLFIGSSIYILAKKIQSPITCVIK